MSEPIVLREADVAMAEIHPELGGWLTRYARNLPGVGWVDALNHDPAVVARYPQQMWAGNPVLFPHVSYNVHEGKDGVYCLNGVEYQSPQHGFARRVPWQVVERLGHSVTLELSDSELTRPSYPFAFTYRLRYVLEGGRLHWHQTVENRSPQPLPFSSGFHPYLRVPLVGGLRDRCTVRLPRARRFHPVDKASAFFDEPFPAQDLPVSQDVRGTILLGELATQEAVLRDEAGKVEVCLNFDHSPAYRFLVLWSPTPDAPFYCIEPWTALPNSMGRSDGELVFLEPGARFEAGLWMEVRTLS
ncbi:MAG: hypothetical protein RLZ45_669 [Verrucomicrobiota bacterium]|jgi:galactose mutarotase-like enzyme